MTTILITRGGRDRGRGTTQQLGAAARRFREVAAGLARVDPLPRSRVDS